MMINTKPPLLQRASAWLDQVLPNPGHLSDEQMYRIADRTGAIIRAKSKVYRSIILSRTLAQAYAAGKLIDNMYRLYGKDVETIVNRYYILLNSKTLQIIHRHG